MIKLNIGYLNKVAPAQYNDKKWPKIHLQGIHVQDVDGVRYYIATDAQVMLICYEPVQDDGIPGDGITIAEYKATKVGGHIEISTESLQNFIQKGEPLAIYDTLYRPTDRTFPNWQVVIPKTTEPMTTYKVINPAFMKKVFNFFYMKKDYVTTENEKALHHPQGENDRLAPVKFTNEKNQIAVVMPMREL